MDRMIESTVQARALDFLHDYYSNRGSGRIFKKKEVRTKKEYGGKRADGLLVYKGWTGIHVVSMESKSHKTFAAIRPTRSTAKWLKNTLWVSFLFSTMTGGLVSLYRMENFQDGLIYFGLTFMLGFVAYGYFRWNSASNQEVKVLKQLKQYPANEQWLSFSKDSLRPLDKKKWQYIKKLCKAEGFGIILVKPEYQIKVVSRPRSKGTFKNYLKYYSLEKDILKFLQG